MRPSIVSVVLAVFLLVLAFTPSGMAAGAGRTKTGDVIQELRSVTCEGERLEDCKSSQSAQLRDYVGKRVAEGWSKKRILNQVVSIYGNEILLAPPKAGFALLLWVAPFAVLASAGFLIARRAGGWTAGRVLPADKKAGLDRDKQVKPIDGYAARVEAELKTYEF